MMPSERTHTQPREECPEPELWTAPDGMAAETEVSGFLAGLVRLLKPRLVVETGCYVGHTSVVIGMALEANGVGRLIAIDTAPDACLSTSLRCSGLPVDVLKMRAADFHPTEQVDLAFLDSTPDERVAEWVALKPRFALMHDTGTHRPAERRTAENLTGISGLIHFPTPRGCTLVSAL